MIYQLTLPRHFILFGAHIQPAFLQYAFYS